jgi:uncharacterized membrane protein
MQILASSVTGNNFALLNFGNQNLPANKLIAIFSHHQLNAMDQETEKINLLLLKIENLMARQQVFETEIAQLRKEVQTLSGSGKSSVPIETTSAPSQIITDNPATFPPRNTPITRQEQFPPQPSFTSKFKRENIGKSDFEKFVGENLISKIGILILIIGVAIGAKLAIDKGLVSPLTRIILGYLVGVALMGFALKLKAKYEGFSAVLLSGSIAILYFITYAAYAYYQLIPQALTFGLMVIFTSFTVIAAVKYNKQVIAHIGLVGAYAIPFLLSDGSGKVVILFTYMAIINCGILVLAFKKYWKSLYYVSFGLTWIIFVEWQFSVGLEGAKYLEIAMFFATIFFITFYGINLAYKVIKQEIFGVIDVAVLLLNSFVFYAIGYSVLLGTINGAELLGIFTLGNAIIHFVVSLVIYKRKLANKNLFYFILALVITFITMAVPVQLNGNWVTIFWAVEAAILFYLGRMKNIFIYEKLALPLVFLAFFSLLQDWAESSYFFNYINDYKAINAFFNVNFLSACIFIIAFILMFLISRNTKDTEDSKKSIVAEILTYVIPSILILTSYYTFKNEISIIFDNLYQATKIKVSIPNTKEFEFIYNADYPLFSAACGYVYTLFFALALTYLNLKKIKSKIMAVANLIINLLVILLFLTHGLFVLSELRDSYLGTANFYVNGILGDGTKYFNHSKLNIGIRYFSYGLFALLIGVCYQVSKSDLFKKKFKTAFDYLLYIAILWVLSSELLNILELSGLKTGYKIALSILWGSYSLMMIGLGLWKKKKHLRMGAIILFGITLIKLFFYDIASLDTISKTIVFVSLGVLLLLISFLYNKYKHLVNDDAKAEN